MAAARQVRGEMRGVWGSRSSSWPVGSWLTVTRRRNTSDITYVFRPFLITGSGRRDGKLTLEKHDEAMITRENSRPETQCEKYRIRLSASSDLYSCRRRKHTNLQNQSQMPYFQILKRRKVATTTEVQISHEEAICPMRRKVWVWGIPMSTNCPLIGVHRCERWWLICGHGHLRPFHSGNNGGISHGRKPEVAIMGRALTNCHVLCSAEEPRSETGDINSNAGCRRRSEPCGWNDN